METANLMPYLTDPRDQAVLSQSPVLACPRFGELPPLCVGQHRYVLAADGVYLQAANQALTVCMKVSEAPFPLPFGTLHEAVDPAQDRYELVEPTVFSHSAGHIEYDNLAVDDSRVLLDLHTHGNGAAFFSPTDDHDDLAGIHISSVLGGCGAVDTITAVSRVCVHGKFFELSWHPWAD